MKIMKKRQKIFNYLVLFLIVGIFSEAIMYAFGKYYILNSVASIILFDSKVTFSQTEIEKYFSTRDTVLGWPATNLIGSEQFDRTGARPSPAFPEPVNACVSLYGDSFSYGTDVDNEHAWGNVLSQSLGCRVANYGVPGYGTDQAYLRFKNNNNDEASTVILGFAALDILRIINQDRRLVWDQYQGIRLKPRFILTDNNELKYIPIPPISQKNLTDYLKHPKKYLHYEFFLPNSDYGGNSFKFPFVVSVGQALLKKRTLNFLLSQSQWLDFFDENHESKALSLLVGIFQAFDELVKERGKRPIILIIPDVRHLKYHHKNGISPVKTLLERLQQEQITYVDLSDDLLKHMGDRDICEIFAHQRALIGCGGHYNNEGNEIIANIVKEYL